MRALLPLVLVTACGDPCPTGAPPADPTSAAYTRWVTDHLDAMRVPGAGIALLADGSVVFEGGYGFSDKPRGERVEPDTAFMLASVSKLFTATAVVRLAEQGRLDLDAPIGDALPWPIRHPTSDQSITARLLLKHQGGIHDRHHYIWSQYGRGDADVPLEQWIFDYLEPSGRAYGERNFTDAGPGAGREYSNVGYALLGLIAEKAAGEPFDLWSEREVIAPLAPTHAAWKLARMDETRVAHPHRRLPTGFWRLPHYGYPDYPDGQLRATAGDVARLLAAFADDGAPLLGPEGMDVLREGALESREMTGLQLRGHEGADRGVSAAAWYAPKTGDGFVLLLNARVRRERHLAVRTCLVQGLLRTAQGL
jgi:CubicO group peptidase (beta-lactamase class C family)